MLRAAQTQITLIFEYRVKHLLNYMYLDAIRDAYKWAFSVKPNQESLHKTEMNLVCDELGIAFPSYMNTLSYAKTNSVVGHPELLHIVSRTGSKPILAKQEQFAMNLRDRILDGALDEYMKYMEV